MSTLSDLTASYAAVRKRIWDAGLARERRLAAAVIQQSAADIAAERTKRESQYEATTARRLGKLARYEHRLSLAKFFARSAATSPTSMAEIAFEVCNKYGVTLTDLRSIRRNRNVVRAREEAQYRCRHETGHSYPAIGKFFHRDHSSVISAVAREAVRRAR